MRRLAMLGTALAALLSSAAPRAAELKPRTREAWERYQQLTEQRVERELGREGDFLPWDSLQPEQRDGCRREVLAGGICVEEMRTLTPEGEKLDVPKGMIHHWLGGALIPGVTLEDVLAFVQSYDLHQDYFDEVEASRLNRRRGQRFEMSLRLVRTKVITVHYNTDHEVVYRSHGPERASSLSRSTRIAELEDAGEPDEHEKPPGDDRGFLWRLNSYWRFEQTERGVVVSCESISLSRGIPPGLGWLIGGYVKSVPRESLEATLGQLRDGVERWLAERQPQPRTLESPAPAVEAAPEDE